MKFWIREKRSTGWVLMALVALLAALVLTACGSSGDSSTTDSGSGESAAASTESEPTESSGEGAEEGEAEGGNSALAAQIEKYETPPTEIVEKQIGLKPFKPKAGGSIYTVACDQSIVACHENGENIKAAAEAIGYKDTLCDTGTSPEGPSKCFTQAINAKPSAIIAVATGVEAAPDGYAAAEAAGIPVIGLFTGDPGDGSVGTVQMGADGCSDQGKMMAEAIAYASEGTGNVLLVTEKSFQCDVARQEQFEPNLTKSCPECKLSKLQFETSSVENALPQQLQAQLNQEPDINWIVGIYDQAASIAVTQVQQAGKQDSISVAGMDGNPPNIALLQNEEVQKYDIAFGLAVGSWGAVDAAARLYSGQKVPAAIPAQSLLVSWKNAQSLGEKKIWPGPENFEGQFEELWEK